jgi:ribulose-5-phosphate 4-epimerase/fuculose-1-phosphate aldolase
MGEDQVTADIASTAAQLTLGCRVLAEQEIIDAYGHLSARAPDRENCFVISRAMSPALVTEKDFVVMDFDGNVLEGEGFPNQEWPIHACVYRARPDVGSVLHSHSYWSRVFGLSPVKLRGVLMQQVVDWNQPLPIYRDAGLIRNVERGNEVVKLLGQGSAMLLRSHGDVVADRDVIATAMRSIALRDNAKVLHAVLCQGGGEPDYWTPEEAAGWKEPISGAASGAYAAALQNRLFEYFEARVNGRLRKLLNGEG